MPPCLPAYTYIRPRLPVPAQRQDLPLFAGFRLYFHLLYAHTSAGTHPPSPHAFQALDWNGYRSGKDRLRQIGKLLFQSGREHRQTHDLDQTDIFFLDVMQLRVRMVNTKRILIRRDVIAEHQIQLIESPFFLAIGVIVLCGSPSVSA